MCVFPYVYMVSTIREKSSDGVTIFLGPHVRPPRESRIVAECSKLCRTQPCKKQLENRCMCETRV